MNVGECYLDEKIELVDCHTHTYLSGHGIGTVEELVIAALDAGLTTLAITEHAPLPNTIDPNNGFSMSEQQMELYLEAIDAVRAKYSGIEIIAGTEVDWRRGEYNYIADIVRPFELVYCSVHMLVDGFCFDNRSQLAGWDLRGVEAVWQEYFELWKEALSSKIPFDVMAHPDLPKKFGHIPDKDFLLELYEGAAEVASKHGVMLEVNTSGWRKPVGEQYPSLDFLKVLNKYGVDCTVGSDAHSPKEVAYRIRDAYVMLKEAGYTKVAVPTAEHTRRYIDL